MEIKSIKKWLRYQATAHDDAKRTAEQGFKQNWNCSQIENEEEEEEEDWQKDQTAAQWDEEQKLEEILERRRMEGNSWQLEVMQRYQN